MIDKVRAWWASTVILVAVAAGCEATTNASVAAKLKPRAAFDLDCPVDQVKVKVIEGLGPGGHGSYGARGCDRRVRYETKCDPYGTDCLITTQSLSEDAKPPPAADDAEP